MARGKEFSMYLRLRNVDTHKKGKGNNKVISKHFLNPVSIVQSNVKKYKYSAVAKSKPEFEFNLKLMRHLQKKNVMMRKPRNLKHLQQSGLEDGLTIRKIFVRT